MMSLLRKITDRHLPKVRPSSWRSLRRPKTVTSTSRDCPFPRLSQPRSHHRASKCAPTGPARCGRRSVQSRHCLANPSARFDRLEIYSLASKPLPPCFTPDLVTLTLPTNKPSSTFKSGSDHHG